MAVRPENILQGYDVSRFIGEVRKDILCSVCQDVPKNPRCCQNKDHAFCHAHILRHLQENSHTCPVCRDPLTPETLKSPTRFMKNYLDDLKIRCDHHDRGCTDEVRLEDLQRHVDECGFTPVMCENEGCGMVVNRRDKKKHEKSFCRFPIAKCQGRRVLEQNVDAIKRQLEQTIVNQAVPVRNQDIIILGGRYAPRLESVSNTSETFNIVEANSIQLPSMNIARAQSASCVYNGDVIVTGGYDGKDGTDSIEILKMNQNPLRWTMFDGKLPVKLSGHAVIVYQDKLYVTGGDNWNENKVSDRIYELTLTPPYTSKLLARMPQPRSFHSAAVVNGHLYIIGGTTTFHNKDAINSVVVYDFINNQLKQCLLLHKPLCRMSTITWGNMIVVLGGEDKNGNALNDVIMYDTETGRSERLPSLRHKRSGHCAVIMHDVIVVLGGWNKEEGYLNSVETFTMGTTEWRELPGIKEKRNLATAVVKPHY